MIRRRITAAAALAALALGAAWWWFATGLSAEERALVGTWRSCDQGVSGLRTTLFIRPDGRYECGIVVEPDSAGFLPLFWSVRGQRFVVEFDARPLHPLLRLVAPLLGRRAVTVASSRFEVDEDTLVLIGEDGSREVYTRVPAN
jgi:hypothetical protein